MDPRWVLVPLAVMALCLNREPPLLKELKSRYRKLVEELKGDPQWTGVQRPAIITGVFGKKDGAIGVNVNKGYEIYICLDGDDIDSAMNVLIHELTHMSMNDYGHSAKFWDNFAKLKAIATDKGLYTPGKARKYCGETITSDGI